MKRAPDLPAAVWSYIFYHRSLQHEAQRAWKEELDEYREEHHAEHWEWLAREILIAGAVDHPVRRRIIWGNCHWVFSHPYFVHAIEDVTPGTDLCPDPWCQLLTAPELHPHHALTLA